VRLVDHAAGMEPLKMHAKCCQVTWRVGLDQHQSQQNCNQDGSVATYIDLLVHIVDSQRGVTCRKKVDVDVGAKLTL